MGIVDYFRFAIPLINGLLEIEFWLFLEIQANSKTITNINLGSYIYFVG